MRLSEVLVAFGLSAENIFLPFLFIVLPFLSFTIPMAYLFAVLLGFSRMSSDGEYTALLAAGYSLRRAALPVMVTGGVLFFIGVFCALNLEPWGRRELVSFYHRKTQGELDNIIKYKLQAGVFMDDFLGFVLYAERISADRTRFDNVMLAPGGSGRGKQGFTLLAPSGAITGSVENADLRMSFDYGVIYAARADSEDVSVTKFKRAEIDILRIFQEQIFGSGPDLDDYRSLPPMALNAFINDIDKSRKKAKDQKKANELYYKARYLLHQRISLPFSVITFALFAMVLGIQDPRRGKNSAYLGAIATVIAAYVFMMGFKWMGEQGYMPAPLASWMPNIILLMFGAFVVYQRNRLPPSEGTLDPRNIPGINRWWARAQQRLALKGR